MDPKPVKSQSCELALSRKARLNARTVLMLALAVIGQDFDHAAFGDAAMAASLDHQFQFGLQGSEAANTLLHLGQAGLGNDIRRAARLVWIVLQADKGANRIDVETQFARMPDKGEPPQVIGSIEPAIVVEADWRGQEADLLIIADGRNFHAAAPCCFGTARPPPALATRQVFS